VRSASSLSSRAEQSIFKSGLSGTISQFQDKQTIYSQGKTADTLFYIREGHVMLTIRPKGRRPAAVAVLDAGDFFGQSCLAGVPYRLCTATAIGSSSILTIKKKDMVRTLRRDSRTSNCFLSYLLLVNRNYQEQVVDLLVNPAGERLAHVLLRLAQSSAKGGRITGITQTALANMAGTTRSRTNLHMNQFRKRGFIRYHGTKNTVIQVHRSLRTGYLRD
jgi:CRP/FNR family transcriptional regulator, cyclic AMP receptor protein